MVRLEITVGAILVNPWDIDALSESFFKALTLPKPVIKRNMDMMSKYVFSNTANQWGESFLRKVEEIEGRKSVRTRMKYRASI